MELNLKGYLKILMIGLVITAGTFFLCNFLRNEKITGIAAKRQINITLCDQGDKDSCVKVISLLPPKKYLDTTILTVTSAPNYFFGLGTIGLVLAFLYIIGFAFFIIRKFLNSDGSLRLLVKKNLLYNTIWSAFLAILLFYEAGANFSYRYQIFYFLEAFIFASILLSFTSLFGYVVVGFKNKKIRPLIIVAAFVLVEYVLLTSFFIFNYFG